jgi:hypothetical protein
MVINSKPAGAFCRLAFYFASSLALPILSLSLHTLFVNYSTKYQFSKYCSILPLRKQNGNYPKTKTPMIAPT